MIDIDRVYRPGTPNRELFNLLRRDPENRDTTKRYDPIVTPKIIELTPVSPEEADRQNKAILKGW